MIAEPARKILDLAPLRRRIKETGLAPLPPAVVRKPGAGWFLLAGERRWIINRERGDFQVIGIQSWADFLAWMILDLEEQRLNRESFHVMPHDDVSAAFATNRIQDNLRATRDDFPARTIAAYLGRGYETVSTVRTVLKYLTSDLPEVAALAQEGLEDIRAGRLTPSGVHGRVKALDGKLRRPKTSPEMQRKILDNLTNMITSINHELDQLGQLSDQLSPQDCQRWLDALMQLNARGYTLRGALREKINGGSAGVSSPGGKAGDGDRD